MTEARMPNRSARTYVAPRLIRPDAKDLSPEGKDPLPVETTWPGVWIEGPS